MGDVKYLVPPERWPKNNGFVRIMPMLGLQRVKQPFKVSISHSDLVCTEHASNKSLTSCRLCYPSRLVCVRSRAQHYHDVRVLAGRPCDLHYRGGAGER